MKTNSSSFLARFAFVPLAVFVCAGVQADALPSIEVRPHSVDLTLPVEAVVEAVTQTTLTSQVSGRVTEMRVDTGKLVSKDDVLLKIDAREASEVAVGASAQYQNAKANYERLKSLRTQNFISAAALDKARADFVAAQAAHGQANVSLGYSVVRAPIAGMVSQRLIELGETAAPGSPLLTIYDPAGLRVTASIPQYQIPQVRDVKEAKIEFPELGKWVGSTSVNLLPTADASTHVSQVRVGLPEGMENIVPGMFARVHFVIGRAQRLTVPADSIVRRGEVAAVYVRNANGTNSLRQLRLGERYSGGETEVLAGLSPGERVVLDPVKAGIELQAARSQINKN